MPAELCFHALHPWALLPFKHRVDASSAARKAELYAREFRWLRASRVGALCWPWRVGQELGWLVPSPVDVRFTPLCEVEVEPDPTAMQELGQVTDHTELWRRERSALALKPTGWLRFHQYRTSDGWMSMFLPNGEGSVEWHLGWQVVLPEDAFLLVMPGPAMPELEVPLGVFDAKTVCRLNATHGVSIAIRPCREVSVRRGDPIARLVLLHADSVRAKARFLLTEEGPSDPE